jgi:hypothetical protein
MLPFEARQLAYYDSERKLELTKLISIYFRPIITRFACKLNLLVCVSVTYFYRRLVRASTSKDPKNQPQTTEKSKEGGVLMCVVGGWVDRHHQILAVTLPFSEHQI